MTTRRQLLAALLALTAWPSFRPTQARAAPRFHIVDGWILTDADVDWLAGHDR